MVVTMVSQGLPTATIAQTGAGQYTPKELRDLGITLSSDHVRVDRSCIFFGANNIRLGSDVRIDAYCVLSGSPAGLEIGNHVHLSVRVAILGQGKVTLEDFCGLSANVAVFSSNDDYSGGAMTNPTIPDELRNVTTAAVCFRRHVVVGAGSVILPGVTLGIGAAVGALTVVRRSIPDFAIVAGNPMQIVGERGRKLLQLEERMPGQQVSHYPTKRKEDEKG
jgi:dTDP-4-amino-4,6-dideoxy-D-glucose acyltransferase